MNPTAGMTPNARASWYAGVDLGDVEERLEERLEGLPYDVAVVDEYIDAIAGTNRTQTQYAATVAVTRTAVRLWLKTLHRHPQTALAVIDSRPWCSLCRCSWPCPDASEAWEGLHETAALLNVPIDSRIAQAF